MIPILNAHYNYLFASMSHNTDIELDQIPTAFQPDQARSLYDRASAIFREQAALNLTQRGAIGRPAPRANTDGMLLLSRSGLHKILKAMHYATQAHTNRCNEDGTPYINLPVHIMHSISSAGITDPDTLTAALLYGILDADITYDQIVTEFGEQVAVTVAECTADKTCTYAQYAQRELAYASEISKGAQIIKLAEMLDDVNNLSETAHDQGCVLHSYAVWLKIKGASVPLSSKLIPIFTNYGVMDMPADQLEMRLADWFTTL